LNYSHRDKNLSRKNNSPTPGEIVRAQPGLPEPRILLQIGGIERYPLRGIAVDKKANQALGTEGRENHKRTTQTTTP